MSSKIQTNLIGRRARATYGIELEHLPEAIAQKKMNPTSTIWPHLDRTGEIVTVDREGGMVMATLCFDDTGEMATLAVQLLQILPQPVRVCGDSATPVSAQPTTIDVTRTGRVTDAGIKGPDFGVYAGSVLAFVNTGQLCTVEKTDGFSLFVKLADGGQVRIPLQEVSKALTLDSTCRGLLAPVRGKFNFAKRGGLVGPTHSLSNNISAAVFPQVPVVGEGATLLGASDRHAGTVVELVKNKAGQITGFYWQEDDAERIDANGMSETQEYAYTRMPNAHAFW